MKTRKQLLIPLLLTVLAFGGILAIATFYDLKISDILTSYALSDGTYYSDQWFGATFAIIGSAPVYLGFALGFHILFHYAERNYTGAKKTVLMILMSVLSLVAYYVLVSDVFRYFNEVTLKEYRVIFASGGHFSNLVFLACGMGLTVQGTLAVNNLNDDTVKRLFRFAVAVILIAAIPTILINLVFKSPIGRIRYRAMNLYPDDPKIGFAAFSRWYEWKGQWLDKDTMMAYWGNTDVLKSCPSGHTSAAATSYALILLNDVLDIKSKKIRFLNRAVPVIWTGLVALSRIVVGAHFLSDVLLGSSLTYLTVIIVREIVICRGENVRVLLGKTAKAEKTEDNG